MDLPQDPAVALDKVRKTFGGAPAVDGMSLTVPSGQFLALVGHSGSGKTTVLKLIHRLLEPDAGEVRVLGARSTEGSAPEWRRRIGYASQHGGLFPHMTVAENIGVTPSLLGWPDEAIADRTRECLDQVGLGAGFAGRNPADLSGGQRQRVALARALAAEAKVLLMDEPFAALDAESREALGATCRTLHEELGLTTIMVTHDMQEAALLADRIVVMGDGRMLADDTPIGLFAGHPDPQVAALVASPKRQAERVRALLEGRA